jgi:peptidoglycan/LPS O-acetylase OafA/YrhL
MSERRHELDWLRVLAVLLLIYFHSARVFDLGDFYVKNHTLSMGFEAFVVFVSLWFMPLFFFIAGAAAFFALKKRSGRQFASERIKRLFVPLVFGTLVIVSLQIFAVYVQKPGNPTSYTSFWHFQFSHPYMTEIVAGKVDDALINAFTWETGHLWFIEYLLVFSLVTLPLLKSIKDGRLRSAADRLAGFCERSNWGIFLPAVVLMAANAIAIAIRQDLQRLFLVLPFVLGFLLYSDPRFGKAVDRNRRKAFWLALSTTVVLAVFLLIFQPDLEGWAAVPWGPFAGLEMWLWLLAIVGAGRRRLNFKNRVLEYANEGSYPFYILHQTVIVLLALGIIEIAVPMPVKYLLLTTASLVLTLSIYDLLVRRWRPVRFLFGMRPPAKAAAATEGVRS